MLQTSVHCDPAKDIHCIFYSHSVLLWNVNICSQSTPPAFAPKVENKKTTLKAKLTSTTYSVWVGIHFQWYVYLSITLSLKCGYVYIWEASKFKAFLWKPLKTSIVIESRPLGTEFTNQLLFCQNADCKCGISPFPDNHLFRFYDVVLFVNILHDISVKFIKNCKPILLFFQQLSPTDQRMRVHKP